MTKVLLELVLNFFFRKMCPWFKPSGQAGLLLGSPSTVIMKHYN
jgi:hypothetical protein